MGLALVLVLATATTGRAERCKKGSIWQLTEGGHHDNPVVLVHGLGGSAAEFRQLAQRLSDHDVYAFCYSSMFQPAKESAEQLASQLDARFAGRTAELTIIAHSMGGIVTREALNQMTKSGVADRFSRIRFIAVDTPWHGYGGPSDRGRDIFLVALSYVFMPPGLTDMRARSTLFAELFETELADNIETELVFAEEGAGVLNYDKGALRSLPQRLYEHYAFDRSMGTDVQLVNYWRALMSASAYPAFADELRGLAEENALTVQTVHAALESYFPHYPGGHQSILSEQRGKPSFLDRLAAELRVLSPMIVASR